jgi:hypothetical protein
LVKLEVQWPLNHLGYTALHDASQHGDGGNKETQVKEVVYKDGQPVLTPPAIGMPQPMKPATDRAGGRLFTYAYYKDALAAVAQAIEAEQKRYDKAIALDAELTAQISGEKGLRPQLWEERAKEATVDAELNDLKALRVNTLIELELLQQRRDQLAARVGELKKTPTAAARP